MLIYSFIIYQSSKFPFSRVSLIKGVLCESDEIRLFSLEITFDVFSYVVRLKFVISLTLGI